MRKTHLLTWTLLFLALQVGCASRFVEGLRVISGGGGTYAHDDSIPRTIDKADIVRERWSEAEWKPQWQSVLDCQEVDFLAFLDDHRALAGTIEPSSLMGHPNHKGVIAVDARNGKVIWRAERPAFPDGMYTVMTVSPLIVLYGGNSSKGVFMALDPASGALRWQHRVDDPLGHHMTADLSAIVVATRSHKAYGVRSLNLATGAAQWESSVACDKARSASIHLERLSGALYVLADELTCLDAKSGRQRWAAPIVASEGDTPLVVSHPQGVFLAIGETLRFLAADSGRVVWERKLAGERIRTISDADTIALVLARAASSGEQDRVHALDVATGEPRWSLGLSSFVTSPLTVEEGQVYFTTPREVVSLGVHDGKPGFRSRIPLLLVAPPLLPDVLHFVSDKIVVGRECGVVVFDKKNGKRMHAVALGADVETQMVSALQARMAQEAEITAKQVGSRVPAAGIGASVNTAYMATQNTCLQVAQRNANSVFQNTRYVLNDPKATPAEKSAARVERALAMQGVGVGRRMDRAGALMMQGAAIFNNAIALSGAIEAAMKLDARMALHQRVQMQIAGAIQNHDLCIQGRYYIRPSRTSTEPGGLRIVDLTTGRVARLATSPFNYGLDQFGVNLFGYAVDASNRRLLTAGLGCEADLYRPYVKYRWKLPYPSLLSYDLGKLAYHKPAHADLLAVDQLVGKSAALSKDDAKKGIRAAESGKLASLRIQLASGLPLETVDPYYGETLLGRAQSYGHLKTVHFLLCLGAKPDHVDKTGETPLTETAMSGDAAMCRLLLTYGARPDHVNFWGNTALMLAAGGGHVDMVEALLEAGADSNRRIPGTGDPAWARAQRVKDKRTRERIHELLERHGAKHVTAKVLDEEADALIAACRSGDTGKVKRLLDAGAPYDRLGGRGDRAIVVAAEGGHLPVVRLLVQRGANPGFCDSNKRTALKVGRARGHPAVVTFLEDCFRKRKEKMAKPKK